MKRYGFIILSSIFILAACGTTETDSPNGTTTDEEFTETGDNQDDTAQEEADSTEETSDQQGNGAQSDEIDFTYNPDEVETFDLHIELINDEEWDYEFERSNQDAEIEHENGSEEEREGEEAFQEIEEILSAIQIDHERSLNEMMNEILDYLDINRDDVEEFDVEIETGKGEKLGFKYHIREREESTTVDEFDMDLEFLNGDEWEYEYELSDQDFSIEYSDRNDLQDQEAQDEMERILSEVTIDLDQSISSIKEDFLGAIDVQFEDIEEWDFEVEYEDEMKIKAKYDRS